MLQQRTPFGIYTLCPFTELSLSLASLTTDIVAAFNTCYKLASALVDHVDITCGRAGARAPHGTWCYIRMGCYNSKLSARLTLGRYK